MITKKYFGFAVVCLSVTFGAAAFGVPAVKFRSISTAEVITLSPEQDGSGGGFSAVCLESFIADFEGPFSFLGIAGWSVYPDAEQEFRFGAGGALSLTALLYLDGWFSFYIMDAAINSRDASLALNAEGEYWYMAIRETARIGDSSSFTSSMTTLTGRSSFGSRFSASLSIALLLGQDLPPGFAGWGSFGYRVFPALVVDADAALGRSDGGVPELKARAGMTLTIGKAKCSLIAGPYFLERWGDWSFALVVDAPIGGGKSP